MKNYFVSILLIAGIILAEKTSPETVEPMISLAVVEQHKWGCTKEDSPVWLDTEYGYGGDCETYNVHNRAVICCGPIQSYMEGNKKRTYRTGCDEAPCLNKEQGLDLCQSKCFDVNPITKELCPEGYKYIAAQKGCFNPTNYNYLKNIYCTNAFNRQTGECCPQNTPRLGSLSGKMLCTP